MAEKEKPVETAAATIAPDPDEDDLDDLDDVLDSFQDTKISDPPASSTTATAAPATSAPTASGPGRPPVVPKVTHDASSDQDFAAQLQAGMGNLIAELDANPEMQAEFEKMMQELIAAGAAGTDQEAGQHLRAAAETVSEVEAKAAPSSAPTTAKKPSSKKAATSAADPDAFQSTIQKTMERMQASDSTAKASSTSAQSEEDLLAQMMKELTGGAGLGGEGGGEEGFNAMLMNMMAHLTNKEILYEPMKELHDKFPGWMEKNAAAQKKEELDRYKEQQRLVGEIVGRFEAKGYSDENEDDREYIVERMQKVSRACS